MLLTLNFFEPSLGVNNFNLLSQWFLVRHDVTVCISELTLLNKAFRVEFLGNTNAQLQMFANEIFKFFRSGLLTLSIEQDTVIVPYDLINWFPEILDHLVDVISFTTEFDLLILEKLLIFDLPFT